jgi:hypothetical protein
MTNNPFSGLFAKINYKLSFKNDISIVFWCCI